MRMMWPYTIRLNPAGIGLVFFGSVLLYYLYSTSDSTTERLFTSYKRKFAAEKRINCTNVDNCLNELISLKQLLAASIKAAEAGGLQVVEVRKSSKLEKSSKGKTKEGANDILTQGDIKSHITMVHGLSAAFPNLRIISEENNHEYDRHYDILNGLQSSVEPLDEDLTNLPDLKVPYRDAVVWIDPLDATQEYSENLVRYVTTMVCVAVKGQPTIGVIHKPFSNLTFWAWVGHGISPSLNLLVKARTSGARKTPTFIVSRSHSGDVEKVIKRAFADKTLVIPAGGAGFKALEVVEGIADAYVHVTAVKKWDICAPNALINSIPNGRMSTLKREKVNYAFDEPEVVTDGLLLTLFEDSQKHNQYLDSLNRARSSFAKAEGR